MDDQGQDELAIEWMMLADAAEINGGKLYLLGGGFDRINVGAPLPQRRNIALAVSINVPWASTNQRHHLTLEFMDEDGRSQAKADGDFEVGRPPGAVAGQAQRIQIALQANVDLKEFGSNVIVASIDGQESRRVSYQVRPTPELEQALRRQPR